MTVTDEELAHLERLARVKLGPESRERFRDQLGRIVDFVRRLHEVDTSACSTMQYTEHLKHYLRKDATGSCLSREEVLGESPEHKGGFFKVPPVIET